MTPNPAYNQQYITCQQVIDHAFKYCQIKPNEISNTDMLESAFFALNQIVTGWVNYKFLQFNEVILPVKLIENAPYYSLPTEVYDVYDVTVAICGRAYEGSTFSTAGGNPQSAFDDNLQTACTQTLPNGSLGIHLTNPHLINYVGVLSNKDTQYKLKISGSNNGSDWITLNDTQRFIEFKKSPNIMNIRWFNIDNPQVFEYYKIEEYGGATLDITELYFQKSTVSRPIASTGRSDFMNLTFKNRPGTGYLFSLQKTNTNINIQLWGAPSNIVGNQSVDGEMSSYNFLVIRGAKFPFDFNYMSNPIDLNRRYHQTLIDHLALEMAYLYKPELVQSLSAKAQNSYNKAMMLDNDKGGIKITFAPTNYN